MLARQKLGRLRMGDKHSVAAYVSVFQATLLHVADMGVTDQIHNFVNGLTKRLQEKVWERQPATLAQAIDFAVSAEAWGNYSHGGTFRPWPSWFRCRWIVGTPSDQCTHGSQQHRDGRFPGHG